jgi:hypothetical protein
MRLFVALQHERVGLAVRRKKHSRQYHVVFGTAAAAVGTSTAAVGAAVPAPVGTIASDATDTVGTTAASTDTVGTTVPAVASGVSDSTSAAS